MMTGVLKRERVKERNSSVEGMMVTNDQEKYGGRFDYVHQIDIYEII